MKRSLLPEKEITPEEVRKFAKSVWERRYGEGCTNIHVKTVNRLKGLPVNIWKVWIQYTFHGRHFDIDLEFYQDDSGLHQVLYENVWES